jgi:predicted Zn-dependent protease
LQLGRGLLGMVPGFTRLARDSAYRTRDRLSSRIPMHRDLELLHRFVQASLHLTHRAMLAMGLGAVHRFGEAEELLRSGFELDPGFFWTYSVLAELYVARDMMAEALPIAKQAFTLAPWYAPSVGVYAGALVRTGDREGGREVARSLGSSENYGVSIGWALFHTTCGDLDAATEWFARAIEERYSMVGAFLQSAIGQPLRSSVHWPSLARLRNLPT